MIAKHLEHICCEDISLIENYNEAINSEEKYECHHRLETELNMSVKELIEKDLYYNRPASELIFLTKCEHVTLHNKGHLLSEDQKEKRSEIAKELHKEHKIGMYNKKHSNETKQKQSESLKGENNPMYNKKHSNETKQKQSESHKGKKYNRVAPAWNKGLKKGVDF